MSVEPNIRFKVILCEEGIEECWHTIECIDVEYINWGVTTKQINPDREIFYPYWRVVSVEKL